MMMETVAGVSHYIGKHLWSAKFLTVVTGYEIPHDDTVMVAKGVILPEPMCHVEGGIGLSG